MLLLRQLFFLKRIRGNENITDESERCKTLKDMYGRQLFQKYMDILDDESVWLKLAKCYKHSVVKGRCGSAPSARSRKAANESEDTLPSNKRRGNDGDIQ